MARTAGKGITLDVLKMVNELWDKLMERSRKNGDLRDNLIRGRAKSGFFTPTGTNETVSSVTSLGQSPSLGQSNAPEVVQTFHADSEGVIRLHLKPSDNPFLGLSRPNALNGSMLKGFGTIFLKNLL